MGGKGSSGGGEEISYGGNNWIYHPAAGVSAIQSRPTEWNWRTPNAKAQPMRRCWEMQCGGEVGRMKMAHEATLHNTMANGRVTTGK